MKLSGELSDWPVADLLNMLRVTNKTATLNLRGERSGVIHFVDGKVSGANVAGNVSVEGEAGSRVAAVDAIYVLSCITSGTFELVGYQGPDGDGWEIDDLLADMNRLNELETDVSRSGLMEGRLMLKDSVSAPVTVVEDDWWALASLVSVLSLQQLEEVFGRARAVRLLHTLWRLDVVEPVVDSEPTADTPSPSSTTPSDEAWLDEIASKAEPVKAAKAPPAATVAVADEDSGRRSVTGVSAPASTVLTGSVLDEMRRLRSRVGE